MKYFENTLPSPWPVPLAFASGHSRCQLRWVGQRASPRHPSQKHPVCTKQNQYSVYHIRYIGNQYSIFGIWYSVLVKEQALVTLLNNILHKAKLVSGLWNLVFNILYSIFDFWFSALVKEHALVTLLKNLQHKKENRYSVFDILVFSIGQRACTSQKNPGQKSKIYCQFSKNLLLSCFFLVQRRESKWTLKRNFEQSSSKGVLINSLCSGCPELHWWKIWAIVMSWYSVQLKSGVDIWRNWCDRRSCKILVRCVHF